MGILDIYNLRHSKDGVIYEGPLKMSPLRNFFWKWDPFSKGPYKKFALKGILNGVCPDQLNPCHRFLRLTLSIYQQSIYFWGGEGWVLPEITDH